VVGRDRGGATILGWRETIALPDFGLAGIAAKIDTGARTSALHAVGIEPFEDGGRECVRFRIDLGRGHETAICSARGFSKRRVTSSNGQTEERLIVKAALQIGENRFRTEFSLTDRSDMVYPVLIGRMALRGRFVVDPLHSYLQTAAPDRKTD